MKFQNAAIRWLAVTMACAATAVVAAPRATAETSSGGWSGTVLAVAAPDSLTLSGIGSVPAMSDASQQVAVVRAGDGTAAVADLSLAQAPDPQDRAMWAATSRAVTLSWASVAGAVGYQIWKDGSLLATVATTSYRDDAVSAGDAVEYVVVSVAPANAPADFAGRTWGLSVNVPSTAGLTAADVGQDAQAQASLVSSYTEAIVKHMTFIPQKYLSAPPAGCGSYNGTSYSFGGDNRSWGPLSNSYRTQVKAFIDWENSGAVTSTKYIGTSHVYRTSTKALLATKTASASGLSVSRLAGSNGSSVYLRFVINATNPFCTGIPNSISAAFTMTVTRSGNWSITSGSHKQMPNHELYLDKNYNFTYTTAYRRSYANAKCLINGACENASMTGYCGSY